MHRCYNESLSSANINRSRDRTNKNEDYYIQTPAVRFNVNEDDIIELLFCYISCVYDSVYLQRNVEYFPNQPIEVTIEAFDELQHHTAELFRFTDSLISSANVMTVLIQSRRGANMNQPLLLR